MFYIQKNGECVSQVYEIKANTWEEAKKVAWDELEAGDILAECDPDAIIEEVNEYCSIEEENCKNYAILNRGAWVNTRSGEDFRKDIWYFSDGEEEYLNSDGEPYDFSILEGEE